MSSLDLTGKIALVTGGGTGIGLMIAKALSQNGAKVYITGRRLEVLQKTVAETDCGLVPLQMDVTDKESIHKAVKVLDEAEGKLDILVNNAGIVGPIFPFISNRSGSDPENATMGDSLFAKSTFEQWEEVFRTNTTAPFFVTMGFLSLLERGARSREGETSSVINISSNVSAVNISLSSFAYGISKAGVDRLTVTMATEFALSKIPVRVNAIAPGVFPSNLSGPAEEVAKWMTQPLPGAFNPNPLRRAGKEHEIGTTAVYLSSSAGEYTNGIVMRVDGGTHLVNP